MGEAIQILSSAWKEKPRRECRFKALEETQVYSLFL